MQEYLEQTARIGEKLARLRVKDRWRTVYGAESHRYVPGDPLEETEIVKAEEIIGVRFPTCYRAFVSQVGHGGAGWLIARYSA